MLTDRCDQSDRTESPQPRRTTWPVTQGTKPKWQPRGIEYTSRHNCDRQIFAPVPHTSWPSETTFSLESRRVGKPLWTWLNRVVGVRTFAAGCRENQWRQSNKIPCVSESWARKHRPVVPSESRKADSTTRCLSFDYGSRDVQQLTFRCAAETSEMDGPLVTLELFLNQSPNETYHNHHCLRQCYFWILNDRLFSDNKLTGRAYINT